MTRPARHLAIVGPTASGKSAVALEVARRLDDVELVSVDSMQVYRRMDIGTAKPTPAEQAEVPHHLLDLVEPWEAFSVARFQAEARDAIAGIERRGHRALLVGGTAGVAPAPMSSVYARSTSSTLKPISNAATSASGTPNVSAMAERSYSASRHEPVSSWAYGPERWPSGRPSASV